MALVELKIGIEGGLPESDTNLNVNASNTKILKLCKSNHLCLSDYI